MSRGIFEYPVVVFKGARIPRLETWGGSRTDLFLVWAMAVSAVRASLESRGIGTAVSFLQITGGGRTFWKFSREDVLCVSAAKVRKKCYPPIGQTIPKSNT